MHTKEVIYRDIKDVRDLFGTKYDPAIMNMLRYYKQIGAI